MKQLFVMIAAALTMVACGNRIPTTFVESNELPAIYPDYTDVTIPVNIAPLTFESDVKSDGIMARMTAGDEEVICGGMKIQPDADDWKSLTDNAKGKAICVEVYIQKDGQWTKFKPFNIYVSPDSIDPYISYRLIAPSYISYEELTINQRCLENYDEEVIYDNMLCQNPAEGQCVNCHNYQQYNPERMQFHARQHQGGTIIAYDGKIRKVNMTSDSILSAGVYPAWHPWLPLIVYSTNKTMQTFHITNPDKIEVFDTQSDLIAYDVERNEVTNIEKGPNEFEVFPTWAPDGKTLYYCSAHFEYQDTVSPGLELIQRFKEVKYNIYRKRFNLETKTFGPRELVFRADSLDQKPAAANQSSMSATLPRVSPDGHYLMFTLGEYGVFHIWHKDADLYIMDLVTGQVRCMDEINSSNVESYHSWSSNGRWVIFSSRRDDGNFTRPFIAHIDKTGHAGKPFELPCADPDYHRQFMKSYNIPEFIKGAVKISPQSFADALKKDGEQVRYVQHLNK
jgi:hypothetical protein